MRVALVTGSYPPDVCGTADYTGRLSDALIRNNIDAQVFYRRNWGMSYVASLIRELDALKPDVIHMQYPTTGYGWKLSPQLIGLAKPLVVTLHEASHAHSLRQLSLYPFFLRSRRYIFTNTYERAYVERLAPWIASKSHVVPIGNNIPLAASRPKLPNVVTCFTIIRPHKGIEDVLAMTRILAPRQNSVRVRIVGAVMPRWASYFAMLRGTSTDLPIDWLTSLDDAALADILAESALAYLPFPDGASERRSSLIAMLVNRACVMTTLGEQTPPELRSCIVEVQSPSEAARMVDSLLADPLLITSVAERGAQYAERFNWATVAEQHGEIYNIAVAQTSRQKSRHYSSL